MGKNLTGTARTPNGRYRCCDSPQRLPLEQKRDGLNLVLPLAETNVTPHLIGQIGSHEDRDGKTEFCLNALADELHSTLRQNGKPL